MGCYHPMHGYIRQDRYGDRRFTMSSPRSGADYTPQTVSCGQCVGCRMKRSREWAIRCMHEASLYSCNCFITLTYRPEDLPAGGSLLYDDFQKFMKRLRFSHMGVDPIVNAQGATERPIRYYMAGEYGTENARPHFHACLFNFDFSDRKQYLRTRAGKIIYRSAALETLWPFGFSSVGDVTFQSAAYVARYIMKKITGDAASSHYQSMDPETGEVFDRVPEFNRMSLKPGIGAGWFNKFSTDVFPHDYVIVNGRKCKPPRYYDNIFKVQSPYDWDEITYQRFLDHQNLLDDNTPDRLRVKESIAISRLNRLKREL